jgi:ATP-dependent RNA helicase RhlE
LNSFEELNLSPKTLSALKGAGFEHPTPIQAQAIPHALAGRDVIGIAATGTGKTAAFLLPIIERLGDRKGTRALVLAPTRELALQIGEELRRFARGRHLRGAVVIGGVGMGAQTDAFQKGSEVVVATPGRLVDHLQQGTARLDQIEVLVLDEADRMLDMGFRPQLDRILARLPQPRQTMLFSATTDGEVAEFSRKVLREPARVEVHRSGTTAARAVQQIYFASSREKMALLLALLQADEESTLVFARTKRRADKILKALKRAGAKAAVIHSDRSQGQRRMALDGFKDGTYRVLVATDIAARGIDVSDIGHVVNFDMPHVAEDYVHRVGRTARHAASGRASSFVAPEERDQLRGIEQLTRAEIPRADVPRDSDVFKAEMERAAASEAHPGAAGGRSGSAAGRRGSGEGHRREGGAGPPARDGRRAPSGRHRSAAEGHGASATGHGAAGHGPGGRAAGAGSHRAPEGGPAPAEGGRRVTGEGNRVHGGGRHPPSERPRLLGSWRPKRRR